MTTNSVPTRSLATEPRADPRLVAMLAMFGLDARAEGPTVSAGSSLADQLAYAAAAEDGFEMMLAAAAQALAPIEGVRSETRTIVGGDGNAISLYIHRPAIDSGPLPCIVHLHGGGMALLQAAGPIYRALRDELAAGGAVVVGVEFRNSAGKLGSHPYPAGLDDCVAAVRWVSANLAELGASHLILCGESGGGNLSLSLAIKAKREGWLDEIAGVYAQCPYISNEWTEPPAELASLRENDGYFLTVQSFAVLANVHDPGSEHADEPTCWPFHAAAHDLDGLPPHVISVNELDPLRDEGLAYYRKLCAAGVNATGRMVLGMCHIGDLVFGAAVPDVHTASLRDVNGFAASLAPDHV
jgi:acetyl esterase